MWMWIHVDACGCMWIHVDACGCMWMHVETGHGTCELACDVSPCVILWHAIEGITCKSMCMGSATM